MFLEVWRKVYSTFLTNYLRYKPLHRALILSSILITCLSCRSLYGQVVVLRLEMPDGQVEKSIVETPKNLLQDSVSVINNLKKKRNELIQRGFITAAISEIDWRKDTVYARLDSGQKYTWAQLDPGNVPEQFLSEIGYREKIFQHTKFSPNGLSQLNERLIGLAENRGYPFVAVKLDSVEIIQNGITAKLNIDLGQFMTIDSLIIKGNLNTSRAYLQSYLGLKNNMPYQQRTLEKIPQRLKELAFVKVIKPFEIGMRPGRADIYLYLDQRKASNFNGVIGIQPDDITGKILLTGDVEINLINSFKQGENVNLKWQRLQTGTQQLDLAFGYPFLLGSPVGVETSLYLYKRDTSFSQTNSLAGINYHLTGGNRIKIFYNNRQANVISSSTVLNEVFVDSKTNLFGIGINFQQLDYRFNPRKGIFIDGSASAGIKKIQRNSDLDDSYYDSIDLQSDLYNIDIRVGTFLPLGNRSTIHMRMIGAYIINQNLFRNEMYRIGGLKSLRGFNEQSIFASAYAVGTVEYRFILEQNSNLFLFFDQGIYENRLRENSIADTPFGFGTGVNFETNAGIFSLTYALGKQFNNRIEIRSGKIHFGFISFF